MIEYVWYALCGIFAGLTAGLLGVGGGIINVPVLDYVLSKHPDFSVYSFHIAVGTSLAVIIVTSAAAAYSHGKRGFVDKTICLSLIVTGIPTSILSGWIASNVADSYLRVSFGILLFIIGFDLALSKKEGRASIGKRRMSFVKGGLLTGAIAGILSGYLGVGGGIIAVPMLIILLGLDSHKAVGTSSAMVAILGLSGALTYALTGNIKMPRLPGTLGFIHIYAFALIAFFSIPTAMLGAKLSAATKPNILERIFGMFLIIVAARMIMKSILGG